MTRLTIALSDEVIAKVEAQAGEAGWTPEMCVEWLVTMWVEWLVTDCTPPEMWTEDDDEA